MNLSEFNEAIDAAESPRDHLKRVAANIYRSALDGIPADIAESIGAEPLRKLARDAGVAFLRGKYDEIDGLLTEFSSALAMSVAWERAHGSLHVSSPADEIKQRLTPLEAHLWNGIEIDCIKALLQPGERIESVGWYEVVTSQRKILRDAAMQFRPLSVTEEFWRTQLTSADEIRAGIEDARTKAEADEASRHPGSRGTGVM